MSTENTIAIIMCIAALLMAVFFVGGAILIYKGIRRSIEKNKTVQKYIMHSIDELGKTDLGLKEILKPKDNDTRH